MQLVQLDMKQISSEAEIYDCLVGQMNVIILGKGFPYLAQDGQSAISGIEYSDGTGCRR